MAAETPVAPEERLLKIHCMVCPRHEVVEIKSSNHNKRLFFASCSCGTKYHVNMTEPGDKAPWTGRR